MSVPAGTLRSGSRRDVFSLPTKTSIDVDWGAANTRCGEQKSAANSRIRQVTIKSGREHITAGSCFKQDVATPHVLKKSDIPRNSARSPGYTSGTCIRQVLSAAADLVDRKQVKKPIRVDFVAAQRGLGSEEADSRSTVGAHRVGMFSNQLLKFARWYFNTAKSGCAKFTSHGDAETPCAF